MEKTRMRTIRAALPFTNRKQRGSAMAIKDKIDAALAEKFTVPAHVEACARAIRYDLFHGPSWSLIPQGDIQQFTPDHFATYRADLEDDQHPGDILEETYAGKVADTLRDFMLALPDELFFDACCEELLEREPEPWQDEESGEWIDPFEFNDIYKVERRDIIAGVFGDFLAREFSL
jgi:hypothetical protein